MVNVKIHHQGLDFRLQGVCASKFCSFFVCRAPMQASVVHLSFAGTTCKRLMFVFRLQGHPSNDFCSFFVCSSIVQTFSVHFSFAGAPCKRFLFIFRLQEHRANVFYPFLLTKISFLNSLQVKPYCIFAYRVCYKFIY